MRYLKKLLIENERNADNMENIRTVVHECLDIVTTNIKEVFVDIDDFELSIDENGQVFAINDIGVNDVLSNVAQAIFDEKFNQIIRFEYPDII